MKPWYMMLSWSPFARRVKRQPGFTFWNDIHLPLSLV